MGIDEEWAVDATDGCTWLVSWFQQEGAYFAQAWFFGVDEDPPVEQEVCTCPGPEVGVFDTLGTLEVAMGRPFPRAVRRQLVRQSLRFPQPERERKDWRIECAVELHRTDRDGTIYSSFAPVWADDPWHPRWDPES